MNMRNIRKPSWIKAKLPSGENYTHLKNLTKELNLHTVCQEARCPNIGECWSAGTLTFMILGDTCTRSCGFCHVKTGNGGELDLEEPKRVGQAVNSLIQNNANITHVVITSVNRDDKNYESACIFADTIKTVREYNPEVKIEVLIPDFKGDSQALNQILQAVPDVLNHNIETVPRLYRLPQVTQSDRKRSVRPQANYAWSLKVLSESKQKGNEAMLTKSGIMVGLGEEIEEILETLHDLKNAGCDIVTIGQYLQPTIDHLPVSKFYHPLEFDSLKAYGENIIGIPHIEAGPLVRSSYHAEKQVVKLRNNPSSKDLHSISDPLLLEQKTP
ncbi:MAG: lipoyl synthase [Deltaproteobacteria bacterium]|nr:lipoyl synthase [Deltaproteobacteria bacterium]MCK5709309.1 lipoyl synthase [Deltaproteobacteria bacterium]